MRTGRRPALGIGCPIPLKTPVRRCGIACELDRKCPPSPRLKGIRRAGPRARTESLPKPAAKESHGVSAILVFWVSCWRSPAAPGSIGGDPATQGPNGGPSSGSGGPGAPGTGTSGDGHHRRFDRRGLARRPSPGRVTVRRLNQNEYEQHGSWTCSGTDTHPAPHVH